MTPAPAGGERLLLPVPRDSRSRQSRSRHSRGMKGGRSPRSRGILPLPLPCKTLDSVQPNRYAVESIVIMIDDVQQIPFVKELN